MLARFGWSDDARLALEEAIKMSQMYEDDFGLAAAVALHRHIVEAAGDSDMDMQLTQRMIARGRDMGDAETQAVGWSCLAKKLLQHPVARPPLQLETGDAALRLRQTATLRKVWLCLARAQRATHMGHGAIDGTTVESPAARGISGNFRASHAQNARGTSSLVHSVQACAVFERIYILIDFLHVLQAQTWAALGCQPLVAHHLQAGSQSVPYGAASDVAACVCMRAAHLFHHVHASAGLQHLISNSHLFCPETAQMWSRCALLLMSHFYDQRGTPGLAVACAKRLLLVSQPSNSPDAYAVARCAVASAVLLGGDALAACEDLVDVVAFCNAKGLPGVCLLARSLIARCYLRIGACNLGMRAVCDFVASSETMANAVSLVEGQIMLARCMLEAENTAACDVLLRKTHSSVIVNCCITLLCVLLVEEPKFAARSWSAAPMRCKRNGFT